MPTEGNRIRTQKKGDRMRKDFKMPYTIYFTQEEKERIKKLAEQAGLKMAQYIRLVLHKEMEKAK